MKKIYRVVIYAKVPYIVARWLALLGKTGFIEVQIAIETIEEE